LEKKRELQRRKENCGFKTVVTAGRIQIKNRSEDGSPGKSPISLGRKGAGIEKGRRKKEECALS